MWGKRTAPVISREGKCHLAMHAQFKSGSHLAEHIRINTYPTERNDGKLLVFDSSNTIRAGKRTQVDALRGIFKFNRWMRATCRSPHVWHTAIGCPNMVLSGKLSHIPSPRLTTHWRANSSEKFPGVAIQTNTRATPEVYPKTGAFIIPGVVTGEGARAAIACVRQAVLETQCTTP